MANVNLIQTNAVYYFVQMLLYVWCTLWKVAILKCKIDCWWQAAFLHRNAANADTAHIVYGQLIRKFMSVLLMTRLGLLLVREQKYCSSFHHAILCRNRWVFYIPYLCTPMSGWQFSIMLIWKQVLGFQYSKTVLIKEVLPNVSKTPVKLHSKP